MTVAQLAYIFNQFSHSATFISYEELASGHINDTYLIKTKSKPYYILQRINHEVFKDVPILIANKVKISRYLQKKLAHLPEEEVKRRVVTFISTKNGTMYHIDKEGNYWNMMLYIDHSKTFEVVDNEKVAYEGGKLFGEFLQLTADFDATQLEEVIPKFHDMSFRYAQFEEALKTASKERLENANDYIKKVKELKEEMHILQRLKETGKIRLRVTHNDTKISNALFNFNDKGLCVIDTDTVMPGIIHYDFGDAIRTICNTATEDERNLDLVNFNIEYYNAYLKGFLEKMNGALTPLELKYLSLGAKTMIFIMALRFLTDYLNGDIYYKTAYGEHNFDRAKNQFKLLQSFSEKFDTIPIYN